MNDAEIIRDEISNDPAAILILTDWLEDCGFQSRSNAIRKGAGILTKLSGGGGDGGGGDGGGGDGGDGGGDGGGYGYGGYGYGYGDGGGYGYGGYGYGYGGGYGDGDGGGDGDGDGGGDGGGYGYGDGDGDGDGGYGGYGDGKLKLNLSIGSIIMEKQFCITVVPTGSYWYIRIGWLIPEDLFGTLYNSRVIRLFGRRAQISNLAKDGPQSDTQLLDLAEKRQLCLTQLIDCTPADPDKWTEQCPKPEWWDDE